MPDEQPASPLPWPKEPPPGWPPKLPWPPTLNTAGQKKCIEACMAAGGSLSACAIICAILDGVIEHPPRPNVVPPPPPPPPPGDGISRAIQAIDDEIIQELKQVNEHRANANAELQRAASNRAQGNNAVADEQTRSAERENAKAHEIEIEIRGKEHAKARVQQAR
jgi:hypothetical protein